MAPDSPQKKPWGHESHFYAAEESRQAGRNQGARRLSTTELRIEEMLRAFDPNMQQRVERAFKQWNLILRDYMRNETALRLTVGAEAQAVLVRVEHGIPRPLVEALEGREEEVWLLLHRPLIEKTRDGLVAIEQGWHWPLRHWAAKLEVVPSEEEVAHTREYIARLATISQSLEILKRLRSIKQDILGAYFFRAPRPRIELYWMAIGLFAATVGVSPEALTVVVAAHELAHAYTHLGRDIDNHAWDTDAFASSDLALVEGLAQFYTGVICRHLAPRMPEAALAYTGLLTLQSEAYRVHESWVKGKTNAGEIVRVSMIQARATGVTAYTEFQRVLTSQGNALSAARKQSALPDDGR